MKPLINKVLRVINSKVVLTILFLGIVVYRNTGLYSIRPDTDKPGSTSIVIRAWSEPFFNSTELFCLKSSTASQLTCSDVAMAYREKYPVLLEFPWWEFAHTMSTRDIPMDEIRVTSSTNQ